MFSVKDLYHEKKEKEKKGRRERMFIFINFTYIISFSTYRTPKRKVLKDPFQTGNKVQKG